MKNAIGNYHDLRLSALAERLTKNNFGVPIEDPCVPGVRM
jgi:hypothetical protein